MKSLISNQLHASFNKTKETSAKVEKTDITKYVETCLALSSIQPEQNFIVAGGGYFPVEEYEIHSPMAGLLLPCSVTFSGDKFLAKELRKHIDAYSYDVNNVLTPWEFKSIGVYIAGLYRKQFVGMSVKSLVAPALLSTVEVITDGSKVKLDNPGSVNSLPVPLTIANDLFEEVAFRDQFEDVINRVIVNIVCDLKAKQN